MTTTKPISVGSFDDLQNAQRAIQELRSHGFREDEIGIIGHVGEEGKGIPTPLGMKSPEWNATRGVAAGGLCGAVVGLMVAVITPLVATAAELGQWFQISFGAVLGAAVGGALFAFGGLLASRLQGRFYESELEKGRFLVTVKNAERKNEALTLLGRQASRTTADSR